MRLRAVAAGPGAARALRGGGTGRLEIALGAGGYVRLGADGWVLLAGHRAVVGPLTLVVSGLGGVRAEPVGRRRCRARRWRSGRFGSASKR